MSQTASENPIYEFTHLELGKEDFERLVFMNPPEGDAAWDDEWLVELCVQPLQVVAEEVITKSTARMEDGATKIFENLQVLAYKDDKESWFEKHRQISECFHKSVAPALWIRNLGNWDHNGERRGERKDNPYCKYYIDDGNKRSLVYAVKLACGEEQFQPVKAIHATSWDFTMGILGHQPQVAGVLEHKGEFQNDLSANSRIKRRIKWNRVTNEYS